MSENIRARRGRTSLLSWLLISIVAGPVTVLHASSSSSSSSSSSLSSLRSVSAVTLHLVDRVGLPSHTRTEMMRETTHLWREAGVDVRWSAEPDGEGPHVTVIVTPHTPEELRGLVRTRVMASILFIDKKPTTLIAAYPEEVLRLLETVRMDSRGVSERPAALRHRLMGRVLGRAIAHELGHFLFGSADHAPDGLMRATHRLDDLTSPFRHAFRVEGSVKWSTR